MWQPTQPMPQVTPAPGTYAPPAATPQAQSPGYPAAHPAPQGPPQYGPPGQPATPKRGLGVGAIIAIVAGVMVLAGIAIAVIALVVVPMFKGSGPQPPVAIETPAQTVPVEPAEPAEPGEMVEGVYQSALDAAAAEVPQEYVVQLAEESGDTSVYWAGPPNSEWDTIITVGRTEGGWKVTQTAPFSTAGSGDGDGSDSSSTPADDEAAARGLLTDFLTAIKEDRPKDSQKLTISPFRDDPASAQYSNGEFKRFTIDRVEARGDGTFWVYTTEIWTYGTDKWRYDVVPTEAGLRIRDLGPAR